jgi:arylsulfatase A-like enzyme
MARINGDLSPEAPTIFELVPRSMGALSIVTRGLSTERRIGALTPRSALRAAITHFRGDVERWLDLDRAVGDEVVRRTREQRPDYLFAAFTGIDKASHARGHDDALVRNALAIVDDVAGRLRADAERGGWWKDTHLWIASDHGHGQVHVHDDLAGVVARAGHRTVSHPWTIGFSPDAAVMVSGNAMAHVYVELEARARRGWPALAPRWQELAGVLLARPSVDLMILPDANGGCDVHSASSGVAVIRKAGGRYEYVPRAGDPLRVGRPVEGGADAMHDATRDTDYPDAIVQIAELAASARAGDIILSAAPGYDFRDRYEPIPHRSAHGALHREHMLVPLLTNRPAARRPRRTTDVFASTLHALGVAAPSAVDGRSFL